MKVDRLTGIARRGWHCQSTPHNDRLLLLCELRGELIHLILFLLSHQWTSFMSN